jgi:hypothetical protein
MKKKDMAEDGVFREPFSGAYFPANREKQGKCSGSASKFRWRIRKAFESRRVVRLIMSKAPVFNRENFRQDQGIGFVQSGKRCDGLCDPRNPERARIIREYPPARSRAI